MCDSIPKLREGIKEASMTELKDFLENIRKHSGKIGEIAMKQVGRKVHSPEFLVFLLIRIFPENLAGKVALLLPIIIVEY